MAKRPQHEVSLETGDRIFNDVTEAIRWKHRLSHIRGRLLTKCPFCNLNFFDEEMADHQEKCQGRSVALRRSATKSVSRSRKPARQTETASGSKLVVKCKICRCFVPASLFGAHMKRVHHVSPAPRMQIPPGPQPSAPPKRVTPRVAGSVENKPEQRVTLGQNGRCFESAGNRREIEAANFDHHSSNVRCPACNAKVPFTLEMHMRFAHSSG
jgi:hypothetical protein